MADDLIIHDGKIRKCTSTARDVEIPEGVTKISRMAFKRCPSIMSVKIPASMAKVDALSFNRCKSLKSVVISDGVSEIGSYAFANCSSITSLNIPDSVIKIGRMAFTECVSLSDVSLSKNLKEIDSRAFEGCKSLVSVNIPAGIPEIKDGVFYDCFNLENVKIPASVTKIGTNAFKNCIKLNSLEYSGTMEQWSAIEKERFWRAWSKISFVKCSDGEIELKPYIVWDGKFDCNFPYEEFTIPNRVMEIVAQAFMDCKSLKSVVIPDGVRIIGGWAFNACSSLTSVFIPASVTRIDRDAFSCCTSLESMEFGGTKAQWEAIEKDEGWQKRPRMRYMSDEEYNEIGERYFSWREQTKLSVVKCTDGEVPLELYIIKDGVFKRCLFAYTDFTIPDGVTEIGKYALTYNLLLESVVIPECVKKIDKSAFDLCRNLSSVHSTGTKAQWEAIEKDRFCFDDVPATTVECSDGIVGLI